MKLTTAGLCHWYRNLRESAPSNSVTVLFVSVVVSMEISRRSYFQSDQPTFLYIWEINGYVHKTLLAQLFLTQNRVRKVTVNKSLDDSSSSKTGARQHCIDCTFPLSLTFSDRFYILFRPTPCISHVFGVFWAQVIFSLRKNKLK